MRLFIFALAIIFCLIGFVESNCYQNWSRCTPQTKAGTGILWKTCPEYCRKCMGMSKGGCKKVNNKECSGGYQCQCGGSKVKTTWDLGCQFHL